MSPVVLVGVRVTGYGVSWLVDDDHDDVVYCEIRGQAILAKSEKECASHSKPVTIKVKSYANCTYVNNKTIFFFGSCDFPFVCLIMLSRFVCVGFGARRPFADTSRTHSVVF